MPFCCHKSSRSLFWTATLPITCTMCNILSIHLIRGCSRLEWMGWWKYSQVCPHDPTIWWHCHPYIRKYCAPCGEQTAGLCIAYFSHLLSSWLSLGSGPSFLLHHNGETVTPIICAFSMYSFQFIYTLILCHLCPCDMFPSCTWIIL